MKEQQIVKNVGGAIVCLEPIDHRIQVYIEPAHRELGTVVHMRGSNRDKWRVAGSRHIPFGTQTAAIAWLVDPDD